MTRAAPAWLAEFQAQFGSVIRTPLDRASGTLTAATAAYDARFVAEVKADTTASGLERLAVYNRQYWFRLFGVLHSSFPLTSRLMGYWAFNELAARFLLAQPPRGWDIARVADGFEGFFEHSLPEHEGTPETREAWFESARIDAAHRDVFSAPQLPAFRPSASDAPRLLEAQLVVSAALRIVTEHRALLALRAQLHDASDVSVDLPPRHTRAQAWAIFRTDPGTAHIALDAREAELIQLLSQHSIGDALGRLERSCPEQERARLPEQARAWLARSVELGFWCGLRTKT